MADGQVVFEITGDNKPIKQSLRDTTNLIEKEGKKWDAGAGQTTDSIGGKFSAMFGKIATAATAAKVGQVLVKWGKEALEAASALQEVQNVVDVTFGESAGQIDVWAKNAITQFGLTETQAKQFASTMGAMMKSSGLAGNQIVSMSENLAGLAADMASFYNMDFETAFNKIRSGISGETEPLKQLGINMSVANLEAFALTQGITKAFDKMSQSEQIVLRYQYLMQATADAQGDFARTSDGYANGLRLLDSQINSLKTSLGTMLIPAAQEAVGWLNSLVGELTQPKQRTVLDDFADIQAETNHKIGQIEAKANEAKALVEALESLAGKDMAAEGLTAFVETLNTQFGNLGEAVKAAREGNYAATIRSVAQAISSSKIGGDAKTWESILTAIGDKMPAVNAAAAAGGETPDYLKAAADAVNELGGDAPALWASLVETLGSDKAQDMVEQFAAGATGAAALQAFATGANSLKSGSKKTWEDFLNAITKSGDLAGIFDHADTASGNITAIAKAFNDANIATDKTAAWGTLLSTLQNNKEGLSQLSGMTTEDVGTVLGEIATQANGLDLNAPGAWDSLMGTITEKIPGLNSQIGSSASNITALADALAGSSDKISRADAWQTMLGVFTANVDGIAALRGSNNEETYAWLGNLADQANKLNPDDAEGWDKLFTALITGLPGLEDTEEGKSVLASLEKVGGLYDTYGEYLNALGVDTDGITNKQEAWLRIVQRLIQTIPGLSSIINQETGEVKGGSAAIKQYVKDWSDAQKAMAMLDMIQKKRDALSASYSAVAEKYVNMLVLKQRYKAFMSVVNAFRDAGDQIELIEDEFGGLSTQYGHDLFEEYLGFQFGNQAGYKAVVEDAIALEKEYKAAYVDWYEAEEAHKQAEADLEEQTKAVNKEYENQIKAMEAGAEATDTWSEEVQKSAAEVANALTDAANELADYMEQVRESTESQIKQTVKGFEQLKTAKQRWDEAMNDMDDLRKQMEAEGKTEAEINIRITGEKEAMATVGNMTRNLQSQIDYMNEYMENLRIAMGKDVDKGLLAELSDGSQESSMYLYAIANASAKEIKDLNDAYQRMQAVRGTMTDELTTQRLKADENFNALLEKTNSILGQLSQYEGAKDAMGKTVQGIADGIASKIPDVELQVDKLAAALSRLYDMKDIGNFRYSDYSFTLWSGGNKSKGSQANGLEYVTSDGWRFLHQGERVQTAAEAELSRRHALGSPAAMDYGAMGSAMWENAPNLGGNVYLDGQTVGKIISGRQADSFRALERSGWRG